MDVFLLGCMAALCALVLLLFHREGLIDSPPAFLLCTVLTVFTMSIRLAVFDYETLDYQNFLSAWVEYFRSHGGFAALSREVGNYNIPYLYFLALFSYLHVKDLYLIKLLSTFFDILLAWACMLLLSRFSQSKVRRFSLFFLVLCWPTVFLNSALWGQCDSSYTALAILSLILALDEKPVRSMLCAALSFGFKLQAVFILPIFAVLWMKKKIKIWHFLLFPVCYFLLVLPAVLLGRPLLDTLTLYFQQTGSIGSGLNYNSPSVFSFFQYQLPEAYHDTACRLGIAAAFFYMFILLGLCWHKRKYLIEKSIVAAAFLFAMGIPFLLPHMHERYFYLADILSLLLAFLSPLCISAALCAEFASLLGYHAYLKMRYFLLMDRGAWALLFSFSIVCIYFSLSLARNNSHKNYLDKTK